MNTGKIGLILSFIILVISLILFIDSVLFIFIFLLFPPIVLCLLILLSFLLCIYGIFANKGRKNASIGIVINIISIIVLIFNFITFTPPGSIPPGLNRYKFKKACPEAAFWLDFDKSHVIDVKSQNTVIINKFGAISFFTNDEPYQSETIIKYAEMNNWKYFCSFPLHKDDFTKFDTKSFNDNNEEDELLSELLLLMYSSPIRLKNDCTVLVFKTDSPLGYPSYAFISKDNVELVIFYDNPVLPDGYTNYWFDICADLAEIRSEEMELNK